VPCELNYLTKPWVRAADSRKALPMKRAKDFPHKIERLKFNRAVWRKTERKTSISLIRFWISSRKCLGPLKGIIPFKKASLLCAFVFDISEFLIYKFIYE